MKSIKNLTLSLLIVLLVVFSGGCNNQNTNSALTSSTEPTSSSSVTSSDVSDNTSDTVSENENSVTESASSDFQIPTYSGNAYAVINNNIPHFSSSELTTKAYEKYGSLDSLGRCSMAIASCGKEIMPKSGEKRGSISSVYPTGWIQAQYDNVSGKYLYNRCHLIGWQLSAENANRKNLITGTKYLNISGMLPFENMVADYIKETNNHVAYRVTPVFNGNDLLASGVHLEAYSVEDKGNGICFNVYCFNVQPDIDINYATGESFQKSTAKPEQTPSQSQNQTQTNTVTTPSQQTPAVSSRVELPSESQTVYITPTGKRYHLISTCGGKNSYSVPKSEAISRGLTPCQKCAQ